MTSKLIVTISLLTGCTTYSKAQMFCKGGEGLDSITYDYIAGKHHLTTIKCNNDSELTIFSYPARVRIYQLQDADNGQKIYE